MFIIEGQEEDELPERVLGGSVQGQGHRVGLRWLFHAYTKHIYEFTEWLLSEFVIVMHMMPSGHMVNESSLSYSSGGCFMQKCMINECALKLSVKSGDGLIVP